jgi:hypothetical protein
VTGEFVALLFIVILPDAFPPLVGVNVAVTVAVLPGAITNPFETPVALNPTLAPTMVTPETVIFELPAFVRVAVNPALLPTLTLPKLRLVVLEFKTNVCATPAPEMGIKSGEVALLFVRDTEPFTVPAALGAKVTLNEVLPPALIFAGTVNPLMLKPVPATAA